jgi:predicted ATPase/DNA-binding CsgD family transcriptional regulator
VGHELPPQPKAIIGREKELAAARARLVRADVRLLTLTGPPGVGKTRVALELATDVQAEFEAGVRFVDLSPIGDARQVADAIALGLGLRELGRRPPLEVVEETLRDKALLLVLDNFEQVLDAADVVAHLLSACPGLKVIATSRAPLHLRWEAELLIPPLTPAQAGKLFIERAHEVVPNFEPSALDDAAIGEICTMLDGLPLAIELAAARVKLFPPRALLRRILRAEQADAAEDSPLRILSGRARDLPMRQQTLLRCISWSFDLLDANEQALFRRLSVFVGGCTLEAAEAVGLFSPGEGLDVITSLVDKSLIGHEEQPDGEPRLRMLETIREFAREQLAASGEADAVRWRHAAYFVGLAERAASELVGPHQQAWFARLERERDNIRAVERWGAARGDWDAVVRLAAALWPFWLARGDEPQARDRLAAIQPLVGQVPPSPALAGALHGGGLLAEKLGDYATCRSLLEAGLAVARQCHDERTLASVLDSLGRQKFIEGRYAESRALLSESHAILSVIGDQVGMARVLSHVGFLEFLEGRPAAARVIFEQGLGLARQVGDQHRVAEFMDNLGNTFEVEGNFASAARMFEQAVAIWRDLGQGHWLAMALNNLGKVETQRGELAAAREHLAEALSLARRMGNRRRLAYTLSALASLASAEGDSERAVRLDAIASAAVAEIGANPPAQRPSPRRIVPVARTPSAASMTLDEAVDETLAWLAEPARPASVTLTRREHDVVALLARGLTNRQIAEALVVTEGTAENYVQRVLSKLGFSNRAQIAVWAVEQGLRRA